MLLLIKSKMYKEINEIDKRIVDEISLWNFPQGNEGTYYSIEIINRKYRIINS